MTQNPGPSRFASRGSPGRIIGPPGSGIDVHVDVIKSSRRGSKYRRTTTALEKGAALTVHRQREPEEAVLEIIISDVEPFSGVSLTPLWERDHSSKTVARLREAQAFDQELRVWDGKGYFRTPAGKQVWVLDDIDGPHLEGTETGVAKCTLRFGESPRFATQFTSAIDTVDESLADVAGSSVERGRQSTTEVGADEAAEIGEAVY